MSEALTMPAGIVGTTVRSEPVRVDADWMRAYAAIAGADDPAFFDERAALRMHPVFPACIEWPAWVALSRQALPPELAARGVHSAQHIVLHCPVRPGDVLTVTARLAGTAQAKAGARLLFVFETRDVDGAVVSTTHSESVCLGATAQAAGETFPERPPSMPEDTPPAWSEQVPVPRGFAAAYTACSRIHNPIHTDYRAAAAIGFDTPLLHGTATLALAVSAAVRQADTAPTALRATFRGAVIPPATLTVEGGSGEHGMCFRVRDENGTVVLYGALA